MTHINKQFLVSSIIFKNMLFNTRTFKNCSSRLFLFFSRKHLFILFIYFGCAVKHVGSYFPDQKWNQCPLNWEHSLNQLTTGSPKVSLDDF